MMPNMYRIAGELTPNVIHVATRSIASHALSVFGDHSDIMAVRSTGYAFLGAASVQEAMDFALIAHAASLSSSIPFVHFFDGFRTSHEYNSITPVRDEVIQKMIDPRDLTAFRNRALSPDNPFIRGTAQGPDVFFQSREAVNATYLECADKVSQKMELFGRLTGRYYKPFEYIGHPDAERVVIAMGSACHTLEQTVNHLNEQGQKTGLIKVRLFRPFGTSHLLGVLPESCRRIAVLDRTKEPGSAAEPLCLDVIQSLESASYHPEKRPQVIGGRYGLASKEFTPAMALAIFKELSQTDPIDGFTVGIDDDLTHKSLSYKEQSIQIQNGFECLIYADKNDESNKSLNALLSVLESNGSHYVQAYTECSYKKSKSISTTHLRVDSKPINAPYLIEQANLVCCDQSDILAKTDLIDRVKPGGKLLVVVDDEQANPWSQIDAQKQNKILSRDIELVELRRNNSLKSGISIDQIIPVHSALLLQKELNLNMELTLNLSEVPARNNTSHFGKPESVNIEGGINRSLSFTQQLVAGNGDSLAVSEFPVDGTYPSNTSNYRKSQNAVFLPKWDPEACTQCGACTIACPLAALRAKIFETEQIDEAPTQIMSSSSEILQNQEADLMYTIQVNADQCDSCNLCVESCEEEALKMVPADKIISDAKENWKFFESLPEIDPSLLELDKLEHLALREPLFKYPDGDQGCGQAAYLKMISQLYGDRMLVANATGSSSIFGGAIPTTPWSQNQFGQGPAWSNSLFEDNAEFGLGFRLSLDFQRDQALSMLNSLDQLPADLEISKIIDSSQKTESEIAEQRRRVNRLKDYLSDSEDPIHLQLHEIADALVKKSVWIVGGDGWAYDVGFGGLDHAVSTGRNINILILDNEVYDNTGGQMSKSTPRGASAKFAMKGKRQKKKRPGSNAYVLRRCIHCFNCHWCRQAAES